MPVNCHLKFRIIPPETACNDPLAASHKTEVLKLVWDEQGRGECCNGFNIIPKVIWWDFHPSSIHQAQSSCADSHCSLPLLCADSKLVPEHQLQQNFSVLNGKACRGFEPRVLQAPFAPPFWVLSFLCLVDKQLPPRLVHQRSPALPLRAAECHSYGGVRWGGGWVFLIVLGFLHP